MSKKVYIAHTGGTIGMKKAKDGYVPFPGYLARRMEHLPELKSTDMPDFDINEYEPLLDSSDMEPGDWLKIAEDIADNHHRYDGFVVLHGTDTMAYTASALPFILEGLEKPVILTGGQIPLCEIRNDSRENLITAMLIAANYTIPEVCLFFGSRLLRGNRSAKVDADGFAAFDTPNMPPLGTAGTGININWDLILSHPRAKNRITVKSIEKPQVGVIRLFPGISADVVKNMLAPPIKGVVLETYGVGNAPSCDQSLLDALRQASRRGVVIVNCTQCLKGHVKMEAYATGSSLSDAGVISGFDMTTEAALAKLVFLLSRDLSVEEIRFKMQQNLKGELTRD